MTSIQYSRGINTFDNEPAQMTANDFDEFAGRIAADLSPQKGMYYICCALSFGPHDVPSKNSGDAHWRLKTHALPRRYMAFDFDGFTSPELFAETILYLAQWNALIYTTASHTDSAPRARAIIELTREVDREEGIMVSNAAQMTVENALGIGKIKFDQSVYRAEQPLYLPPMNARIVRHHGAALDVDEMLSAFPAEMLREKSPPAPTLSHQSGAKVAEGSRNSAMLTYVGHLRGRGMHEDEIRTLALAANQQLFDPPLDEGEVLDVCSRYSTKGSAQASHFSTNQPPHALHWTLADGSFVVPNTPPPKRDYIFASQATSGALCTLGGTGGVSKTMLMMQIAAFSAVGMNMGQLQITQGPSLLFLGEEDSAERDRRMGAICDHFQLDRAIVAQQVSCIPASGQDIRLTLKIDGNPQETQFANNVIELATAHSANIGSAVKMIVFDHARLVLGGDPNAADDVTQLTRVLTHIAHATGAAVVLLAHSPKSVLSKEGNEINAADIAGSSAFVDNSRSAFMMWGMREKEAKDHGIPISSRMDYVRLENVKANYARTGGGHWFERTHLRNWDVAVLEEVQLASGVAAQGIGQSAIRNRILDIVRQKPGGITARAVRDLAGTQGTLKASEDKVRCEVTAMLEEGLLDRRRPTAEEKKKYKLSGQVREVLVPLTQ